MNCPLRQELPLHGFRWSTGGTLLRWRRRPSTDKLDEKIPLTGITGTNGKTTTSYLVDSILRAAGKTTMLAGTIEYHLGSKVLPAANTTPESLDLHRMLAELDALNPPGADFKAATMEVSSHALALGRVYGLQFHTAVFTNLTQDHLDFHHTMEDYFAAKQLLFTGSGGPPPRYSVINRDDEWGRKLAAPGTDVGSALVRAWQRGDGARAAHPFRSERAALRCYVRQTAV